MSSESVSHLKSIQFLKRSVNIWFAIVVIGQFIFALYILDLYAINGLAGDFEKWNEATPHGYLSEDFWGNIFFGLHVILAGIITIGGPLQLIKKNTESIP